MYASPQQIAKSETVSLAGIYSLENSILVLVDTTVPLLKKMQSHRTEAKEIIVNESDSEDADSLGPVNEAPLISLFGYCKHVINIAIFLENSLFRYPIGLKQK